jgi:serine/threonine protein phosphatase 1
MIWQDCNHPVELNWWIDNGGDTTLASYRELDDGADISTIVVPRSHLQWGADLALMHVDRRRVYVHAAVDPGILVEAAERAARCFGSGIREGYSKGRRHVVHGARRRGSSRPARPTWIVWPGRRGRLVSSTMASPVLRWTISEILV